MLKHHARMVATALFVTDLVVTIFAFGAAYLLVNAGVARHAVNRLSPFDQYLWLLLFIVPVWSLLLHFSGTYRSHRVESILTEIRQMGRAVAFGGIALFAFVALLKASHVSRPFMAAFIAVDGVLLVVLRLTLRFVARWARSRGFNTRSVLIVGTGPGARAHAARIGLNRHWGHRVIGFVAETNDPARLEGVDGPVLGTVATIRRVLCEYVVDEVVVATAPREVEAMEEAFLECERMGIKSRLALDFFPHKFARVETEEMDGVPTLTFSTTPREDWAMVAKRIIDIAFSAAFLAVFSWVYGLIAVVIKLTSRGPVLYRQERVGMNGRRFTFYKFRSMVVDADRRRDELKHLNEMDGPVFKIKNDPRVTRVGRFLRKFSLDELPQMWNVLMGDMSLVGPRPPIPSEVERYESWARRRLSIRPGLTCLWQVSGRNSINFQEWMELDLAYIDNWSLALDFKILVRTVPAVLGGRGAS